MSTAGPSGGPKRRPPAQFLRAKGLAADALTSPLRATTAGNGPEKEIFVGGRRKLYRT